MHFHWQNLTTGTLNPRRGWKEGRAWLNNQPHNLKQDSGVRVWPLIPSEMGFEWHLLRKDADWSLGYGRDSEEHKVFVKLPFVCSLYVLWHNLRHRPTDWSTSHSEWSLRHHDGGLWWSLGANPMGGRLRDRRQGHLNWANLVLGRQKFTREIVETRVMPLPLPGTTITATVAQERCTWKRPRWPWAKQRISYDITPEYPAPIPGKGENAWDVDDDAILQMHCSAKSFEDAIGTFVASVLRNRRRHGGDYDWQPRDKRAA